MPRAEPVAAHPTGLTCYDMLRFRDFRPLFRAFYPHPAHKSALRAEAATHRPAPGKPVWPPSSTWPLFSRPTPQAPRPNSGVRSCADPPPLATACHRQPNWKRPSGARSQRAAPYVSMSPNRAIAPEKSNPLVLARRRPTVDRPLAAASAQRQRLRPVCRVATSCHAYSLIALLLCPNPPSGPAWCPRDSLSPPRDGQTAGAPGGRRELYVCSLPLLAWSEVSC